MSSYSTELAGVIRQFLDDDDWHYEFVEERGFFHFGYRVPGKIKKVEAVIDVKDDAFITYVICPMCVDIDDKNQMAEMMKFLTMSNYGLINGNWELDIRDGEIRYKCYVNCDGIVPSYNVIKDTLGFPAAMYHRYGPGMLQILMNGKSADEAIEECEPDICHIRAADEAEDEEDGDDGLPDLGDFTPEMGDFETGEGLDEQAARLLAMLHSLRPETE